MNLSIPFRINIINEDGVIIQKIPIIREIKYSIDKRYEKGKIYKLYNETDTYIGSTIKTLNERLKRHINRKDTSSKLIIDNPPYKMELIEKYPCRNRYELEKREGVCQKNNECINTRIAGRTDKEYREDNKYRIREHNKEYRENNKDVLKKYYEDNKDNKKKYNKEYRENNKDKVLSKKKKYYEKNKDKINERHRQKVKCDVCDSILSKCSLYNHKKNNCKN